MALVFKTKKAIKQHDGGAAAPTSRIITGECYYLLPKTNFAGDHVT